MNSNPAPPSTGAAIAERLRAHARLCEQVACSCWNEMTAEKFKRIARDCDLAAAEIMSARDTVPQARH